MFKVMALLLATTCLTGCMPLSERGITQERDIRDKTEGNSCSFLDENGRLRSCIDKKYHHNTPQGYKLGVLENGTPVAVMNETEVQSIQVYPDLNTKKAEAETEQPAVKIVEETTEDNPWVLQEEIKTTVILPEPVSNNETENQTQPPVIQAEQENTQAVMSEVDKNNQVVVKEAETKNNQDIEIQAETTNTQTVKKTEDKWWDVSQAPQDEQQTPRILRAEPVCPCADPNIPCPECNDK